MSKHLSGNDVEIQNKSRKRSVPDSTSWCGGQSLTYQYVHYMWVCVCFCVYVCTFVQPQLLCLSSSDRYIDRDRALLVERTPAGRPMDNAGVHFIHTHVEIRHVYDINKHWKPPKNTVCLSSTNFLCYTVNSQKSTFSAVNL